MELICSSGILKPETIQEMFQKIIKTENIAQKNGWYGWGWYVTPEKQTFGACRKQKATFYHTGNSLICRGVMFTF